MAELRITDTNSANDSRGRAFGLEGNDFLYVLIALVGALAFYVVCTVVFRMAVLQAVLFAVPILAVPAAWVLLLRHNKPGGYAEDWFDQLVNREGWSLAPGVQPKPIKEPSRERTRT